MAKADDHTRFQRFETATIERKQLRGAPYNPRTIDDANRARLKDKLASVGLVNTLVWNRRTGNLVSGHQRLSIIDELEGRDDYSLVVSVVDVDEREEKELNVFLNNASAQGDWDLGELAKIADRFKADIPSLGFDVGELDYILTGDKEEETEEDDGGGEPKPPRETQEGTQVLVIFDTQKPSDDFLRLIGSSTDTRYVDGDAVFKQFGFEGPDKEEAKP